MTRYADQTPKTARAWIESIKIPDIRNFLLANINDQYADFQTKTLHSAINMGVDKKKARSKYFYGQAAPVYRYLLKCAKDHPYLLIN